MASGPNSSAFFVYSWFGNGFGDFRACSVLLVGEAIFLIELGFIVSTAVLELRMTIEIFIGQRLNQIMLGCMSFDNFFIWFWFLIFKHRSYWSNDVAAKIEGLAFCHPCLDYSYHIV